jgi:hypothetical protein
MSLQKISGWIQDQIKRYPIGAVELQHSTGGKVDRFALEEGMTNTELASAIWTAVVEDAEELYPGHESTYVCFFYDKSGADPQCRKAFRYSASSADKTELAASEAPTESGLLAMTMRHQEETMRIADRMSMGALAEATAEKAILRDRERQMMDREFASMALVRKHMLDQGALELQREQQRTEALLYNKLLEQAEVFLPLILAHVAKPKPGSEEERVMQDKIANDPPVEFRLVGAFLMTLDPEQYTRLGAILSIPQRAALQEIQAGNVIPELIPIMISRVMNGLTADQVADIFNTLQTDEQVSAFEAIFGSRKHTLGWQKDKALDDAAKADVPSEASVLTDKTKPT